MKSEEDRNKFVKHLMSSQNAVWDVAHWLQSRGNTVTVSPTFLAPSHDEWKDYTDGGDLFIMQRVEVKELSVSFSCAEDWPYKDKFIVCARHAWDRALQKPFAFIYLNKDRTHVATLKGSTHKTWKVEKRTDSRYENTTQDFYFCNLEDVKFMPFKSFNQLSF